MYPPKQSYRIWFTQRSGSTLLCKAIESTGVAGMPGEYFCVMSDSETLCEKHQSKNFRELQLALWKSGTSSNGVFGIKHAMHHSRYSRILQEVKNLQNLSTDNEEEIWSAIFPNCKHIYCSRRNKVRQAVSWWRAIQDNVWHNQRGEHHRNSDEFYEKHYNFDALTHLFKESVLMQCRMQQYFDTYNIRAFTIIYEDFVKDYGNTVLEILKFLELPTEGITIDAPFYEKTADEKSEIWVERFRKEFQKSFGELVY